MLKLLKYIQKSVLGLSMVAMLMLGSAAAAETPQLSEDVSNFLQPLFKLFEAKDWNGAIEGIDKFIAKAPAKSLDRAFLYGLKTQVLGSKGEYSGAVVQLEAMLKIADEMGLYKYNLTLLPMREQDALLNLASLSVAGALNQPIEVQRAAYTKAHFYAERLVNTGKPTAESQSLWARILYGEATIDPKAVDSTLLKRALVEAEKVLSLSIKPKEEHYTLYLALLQQHGDNQRFAELLELLVTLFPNNKSYWPMLFNVYNLMQSTGDKAAEVGSVVTMERAQALGHMTTPKDNFLLAAIYYNIQQYQFAAELLEKGLRNGKIDPEQKNWELLAACYQLMNKEARAIEIFKEAITLFPQASNLEQQIGQIYYNAEKFSEAYTHFKAAIDKGLAKPAPTYVIISYISMLQKNLDDALVFAEKGLEADPKSKEAQSLIKAIKQSIVERENFKKVK